MKKRSHSGINLFELRYFYAGIKSLTGLILVSNLYFSYVLVEQF
nr:MAG TPA: hypothetical protein [Caudoviricetes sp.]